MDSLRINAMLYKNLKSKRFSIKMILIQKCKLDKTPGGHQVQPYAQR